MTMETGFRSWMSFSGLSGRDVLGHEEAFLAEFCQEEAGWIMAAYRGAGGAFAFRATCLSMWS